jgi:outer membrane protein
MQLKRSRTEAAMAALPMALALCSTARAEELANNTVRIGYAKVRFNLQAGDLSGPPATNSPRVFGATLGYSF